MVLSNRPSRYLLGRLTRSPRTRSIESLPYEGYHKHKTPCIHEKNFQLQNLRARSSIIASLSGLLAIDGAVKAFVVLSNPSPITSLGDLPEPRKHDLSSSYRMKGIINTKRYASIKMKLCCKPCYSESARASSAIISLTPRLRDHDLSSPYRTKGTINTKRHASMKIHHGTNYRTTFGK